MSTERRYTMSAQERDELIMTLRRRGVTLARIGRQVGMSKSGVARAIERMALGRPGRDARE